MADSFVDERHLTHAIERAGMTPAGVRMGREMQRDAIVIVRTATVEQVKTVATASSDGVARLAAAIREASAKFSFGG